MLSIIIPTYNESKNIKELIMKIFEVLKDEDYEVIVVDDNSPDGTYKVVCESAKRNPRVKPILRKHIRGLSSAVLDGMKKSKGEKIVVMDADLSHDPVVIPQIITALDLYEVVVCSRRVKGGGAEKWPLYRRLISSIANFLVKTLVGVKIKDTMSGFFGIRRNTLFKVIDKVNPRGYKILLEILVRLKNPNIIEIPFIFRDRKQGYSKLTMYVAIQFLDMLFDFIFKFSIIDSLRKFYHYNRYKFAKKLLGNVNGLHLDAGCGSPAEKIEDGAFIKFLGINSIGVDIKKCEGIKRFVVADVCSLPFKSEIFSAITALEVIEHVYDAEKFIKELNRVAKKSATIILSTPINSVIWDIIWNFWNNYITKTWVGKHVELDKEILKNYLNKYLKIIETKNILWLTYIKCKKP
ncbi:MAG: glycosyltransferase [bacterium]|nr:glycosyltransferase [bacterium]